MPVGGGMVVGGPIILGRDDVFFLENLLSTPVLACGVAAASRDLPVFK